MQVDDDSLDGTVLAQVTAAVSGVPVPIQRSLFKAIQRLCLAAVEWPAAAMEGKATELRAVSTARAALTQKIGLRLADSASVDSKAVQAAVDIHTKKILGRQLNVDAVVRDAVLEVSNDSDKTASGEVVETAPAETIKDDWLDYFEREAELASGADLRLAFGRILAGECRRPGSFSKPTLRTLSQLSQETANNFQLFCNLATHTRPFHGSVSDVRVWDLGKDVGRNELEEFGINYAMLLDLIEAGLVSTSLTSTIRYGSLAQDQDKKLIGTFEYAGVLWGLVPWPDDVLRRADVAIKEFGGPCLTKVGRELSKVVTIDENVEYTLALRKYLAQNDIARAEVRWDGERNKHGQRVDSIDGDRLND